MRTVNYIFPRDAGLSTGPANQAQSILIARRDHIHYRITILIPDATPISGRVESSTKGNSLGVSTCLEQAVHHLPTELRIFYPNCKVQRRGPFKAVDGVDIAVFVFEDVL